MDKPKLNKSRLIIFSVALLIVVVLAVLLVNRITSVNDVLPSSDATYYEQGEVISGGDLSIAVVGATLNESRKIDQIVPGYLASQKELLGEDNDPDNAKVAIVELEITNSSAEDLKFAFQPLVLQSEVWQNGVDYGLYISLNDSEGEDPSVVKANSSKKLKLPYCLYAFQFETSQDWQNVGNRQFELVLSVSPTHHAVSLNMLSGKE